MRETSKAKGRRLAEGWYRKYFSGKGIDIGCGDDPLTSSCDTWDVEQGDAMLMTGVLSNEYDWVYSSHCLEHMVDPIYALKQWWRILKPGGHLVVIVPDEDLYEQGQWPSLEP